MVRTVMLVATAAVLLASSMACQRSKPQPATNEELCALTPPLLETWALVNRLTYCMPTATATAVQAQGES